MLSTPPRPLLRRMTMAVAISFTVQIAAAAPSPVSLAEAPRDWTLDNGIVRATISKTNGTMTSLVYHGMNMMGGGGIWEQTPAGSRQLSDTVTINPAHNAGERAEVSVKGITGGEAMQGTAPAANPGFDIEIRYALARGDSGIYTYAIFSHPAKYPAMNAGESRFITKLNHMFNWLSVDSDRDLLECTPQDWGSGIVIHAKEQHILTTGLYKNSVEHKYSYNAVQYNLPAYGWSSTQNHVGIWFINPSKEYLAGGASKLELVCHYDANNDPDPIILDYWCSGHYGGGAGCNIPAGENWNKVIGPIFVYCDALSESDTQISSPQDMATLTATAGNPNVPPAGKTMPMLYSDALAQAKVQEAAWPFDWVKGVDYPHTDGRGSVSGQLALDDPQAADKKLPHLTVGLAHPDYRGAGTPFERRAGTGNLVAWPHDGNYYQFWADGTADGKFQLHNIRPGTYTLHAFADGVLGEFAQADIAVSAGNTLDLGSLKWRPVRYGKQLWDIGYPDRTGDKFFKGDGVDYWLWGWCVRYGDLFPNDITYTVGKSDYHKDWFFEEVPHALSDAWQNPAAKDPLNQRFGWMAIPPAGEDFWRTIGQGRATTWTIKFNLEKAEHGQAVLRIALAGADGTGGLAVGVNGTRVGIIRPVATNALRYNTDTGVWGQYAQAFDAGLLKSGENSLTLTVPAGELTSGVVYDYLRLELNESAAADAPLAPFHE